MLGFGLTVAGIGMGTVFAELVMLVGVIWVISSAAKMIEGKKNPVTVKTEQPQVVQAAPAPTVAAAQDDDDVAAVIAAAVAAFSKGTMVIKAITRMPGVQAPSWSMAGRQDTMSLRQI